VAGLGLRVGGFGSVTGTGGAVPSAASQPGSATVGQRAFGVFSSQTAGDTTAGFGALILGASAAALLAWLWWTLPR
jgi:hypothetical protein